MGKKILTIAIFLALLTISVFLGYWYWNKYMKKSETSPSPAPVPETTPSDGSSTTPPQPSAPSSDGNIGKEAYALTATTVYDLQGNKVKDANSGDDLGKVTAASGNNFVLDGKYMVAMTNVLTR